MIRVVGLPLLSAHGRLEPRGLPVGIAFMGRAFSAEKLLRFGYAFEQAHPVQARPDCRSGA